MNTLVFGGSVSARRITYEYSIDDVTATWIVVNSASPYANNSDDGHRGSVRAVRVVQLFSMGDSRTERLRVLLPVSNSRRCIARMYLIQP